MQFGIIKFSTEKSPLLYNNPNVLTTIDARVRDNIITPAQAQFILPKFDETIPHIFNTSVTSYVTFKASILTFNFVDGVWKFVPKRFYINLNSQYYKTDYVKIVACDAETSQHLDLI